MGLCFFLLAWLTTCQSFDCAKWHKAIHLMPHKPTTKANPIYVAARSHADLFPQQIGIHRLWVIKYGLNACAKPMSPAVCKS